MKKILVFAVAAIALCSCAKGAKCECDAEVTVAGATVNKTQVFQANDDETCNDLEKRLTKNTGDLGAASKVSNCKTVNE